jgi:SAM-dependent methyltransferase
MRKTHDFEVDYLCMDARGTAWRDLVASFKADRIVQCRHVLDCRRILEVGCGDGALLAALDQRGFGEAYWGLDVSQEAVRRTLLRPYIARLREARVYDGEVIPYANDSFDLIVFSTVLEHVNDVEGLLKEAVRVGTTVFVEAPLDDCLWVRWKVALTGCDYRREIGRVHSFNWTSLRQLLNGCVGTLLVEYQTAWLPDTIHRARYTGWRRLLLPFILGVRRGLRRTAPLTYTALLGDHAVGVVKRV